MMREWDIKVDKRYVDFNRSRAVADIYDALVEIITNSDDSYHRLHKAGKRADDGGDILIEYNQHRQRPSLVVVKDKAEGMTLEDMRRKLGEYGARTSGEGDRGFMARGLKDCTNLGDIRVDSIVDGRHYACQLTRDLKFREFDGEKASDSLRHKLGIEKKSGTVVTLEYTAQTPLPRFDRIRRELPAHFALRDIVALKSPSKIRIRKGGESRHYPVTLAALPGELVIDDTLPVMDYPQADLRFRLWRAPSPLVDYDSSRLRRSGVLIKGGRAIHQCTLFDCEREELAKHYHGRVECPHIDILLAEYDEQRKTGKPHPASNPMLLVDPNRQQGLDRRHPFTRALFDRVGPRLKELVERDRREISKKSGDVTSAEMRKRLDAIAKATNRFWRENVDEDDTTPAEDNALESALEGGIYVLPPAFKIGLDEERVLTVYIRRDRYDEKSRTRVQERDRGVIAVTQSLAKRVAKPHRKREDIVSDSFKVKGIALGNAAVIVRHRDLSVTAHGEVVPKRDPGSPEYESPLGFERARYEVTEGAGKTLKLFADWSAIQRHGAVVRVNSSDTMCVPVLKGGECRLIRAPKADYAEGEVRVEGREITKEQSPADITARLGDLPIAHTKVSVKEKKSIGGGFGFEIRDEERGILRAWWGELEFKPKLLIISAVHPSFAPYADKQDNPATRALVAELIIEEVCAMILQSQMRTEPGKFQKDLREKEPHEVLAAVREELHKRAHTYATIAHKILVGDLG